MLSECLLLWGWFGSDGSGMLLLVCLLQGPCTGNQQSLAHSRLWDAVVGFLHVFAHMQMKLSQVNQLLPSSILNDRWDTVVTGRGNTLSFVRILSFLDYVLYISYSTLDSTFLNKRIWCKLGISESHYSKLRTRDIKELNIWRNKRV